MDSIWTILLGLAALAWLLSGPRMIRGMSRVPLLADTAPLADVNCPSVSILFSARDEAGKMQQALPTLLAQDYPHYEVVAANDRSRDATGALLDEFARQHRHLKVVHVTELPPGWLGKPHGLAAAYQQATGDWLVFTDADVRFAPDVLRRALALARQKGWDHLTMLGLVDLEGFWEKVVVSYFGLGFLLNLQPWQASNPGSKCYVGVGSFQLLKRSTYEAIGTHRRLAMEVVDDIKVGKLVKEAGFRSGLALPKERLQVRWQDGLGNIVRGLTKNAFASLDFSPSRTILNVLALILLSILPFAVLPVLPGTPRLLAGIAAATAIGLHATAAHSARISPLYALTHPLGAVLFAYILLRSAVVTLWRGGVLWRDTFYPLKELRRGQV